MPEQEKTTVERLVTDGGKYSAEMPDGTIVERGSSLYHARHGSLNVKKVAVVSGTPRFTCHVQTDPGVEVRLTADKLEEKWGDVVGKSPMQLRGEA